MQTIEIQNLHFAYSSAEENGFALTIPKWTLRAGDSVVIYGPSGCGKSTLLNLIAGALDFSEGSLRVLGKELREMDTAQKRAHRIQNVGFVFQDFPLISYLTAIENVLLPYRINPILTLSDDVRRRARELLETFGLKGKGSRIPRALSQGERQRVAIARALITQPKLLLADEPTAGLDPKRSHQILDELEHWVEKVNLSLVVVTHDSSLRERFENSLALGDST